MSDINISVDGSEVVASTAQLEKLEAVFAKTVARVVREQKQLERAFKQPFEIQQKAIEQASAVLEGKYFTNLGKQATLMMNSQKAAERQAAAEEKLTQSLEKQAIAAQRAKSDTAFALGTQRAREEAAALEQLNAAKAQQAAREDFLRSKYDQSYQAMRIYKTEVQLLNEALDIGVIDQQRYTQAVDALNEQLQQGNGLFSQFNMHANQAAGRANQMGVVVQQAGYQVGDFLVQVQSGTNWMVAFGQQATQLVGVLPLMAESLGMSAGRLIAISSGLGIAIPLVTAIGAAWMRTSEAQDTAAGSAKRLEDAQKALTEATATTQQELDKLRFGVDETYQAELLKERIRLQDEYNAKVQELRDYQSTTTDSLDRQKLVTQEMVAAIQEVVDRNAQIVKDLENQNRLSNALTINQNVRKAAEDSIARYLAQQAARLQEQADKANQINNAMLAQQANAQKVANFTKLLREEMGKAGVNATNLSNTDLESGIWGGAAAALALAERLGIALENARGLAGIANYEASGGPDQARRSNALTMGKEGGVLASGAGGVRNFDTGSAGGGGGSGSNRLESLISELQTEREILEAWNEEYTLLIESSTESELAMIGGKNEAKLRLEEEYQTRLREILGQEKNYRLNEMGSMFSSLADLAGVGGKKMLKVQAALSAAGATIAAYETAIKAAAEAKTIPGRIAAYAKFLAVGLGAVKQIRSAGGIGGGGGGGGPSSATVSTAGGAPEPQTVFIDSIEPESLYSGQTLINLFEAFYNENDKRGKVFVVAR